MNRAAEIYRDEAARLRLLADRLEYQHVEEGLLAMATRYESMAARAETILRPPAPSVYRSGHGRTHPKAIATSRYFLEADKRPSIFAALY